MEFAAFLAFLKAVGDALGAVNNIYQFVKNVEELSSNPSDEARDRYIATYAAIIASQQATLRASAEILLAIQTLDERVFRTTLADKLGDADQAIQSADEWHRSGSEFSKALALDSSAGALADMLELDASAVYPRPSLIFAFVQIMSVRLGILAELEPEFATRPAVRQPIVSGIAVVRACVAVLERALVDANNIDVTTWVTQGRRPPHEGPRPLMYHTRVLYANASGTASYSIVLGPMEDEEPDPTQALRAAQAVRLRGIADDRAAAKIDDLIDAADRFDGIVVNSEMHLVGGLTGLSMSSIGRARYAALRRDLDIVDSLDAVLRADETPIADPFDIARAAQTLEGSKSPEADEQLLREVLQRFGRRAFLEIVLPQGIHR
jgi:hypothetical protein